MFGTPDPWNTVASGYETDTMDQLAPWSEHALKIAQLAPDFRVLDVACGPGTLTERAAPIAHSVNAVDFSSEMIEILKRRLSEKSITNVEAEVGDGQALRFADESFDAAFSMFGLMFFPDMKKGISELFRVLKPNGIGIISSWGPPDQSTLVSALFGALNAAIPELPRPERAPDALDNPENVQRLLSSAGFREIEVRPIEHTFEVPDYESFWESMERGNAALALQKKRLGDAEWKRRLPSALEFLRQNVSLPGRLAALGFLGIGRR